MFTRHISVTIARPWREVYDYMQLPKNFRHWAAGLGSMRQVDGAWVADGPLGSVRVVFSEKNEFGVLDHSVFVPGQPESRNPLRVVANGKDAEVAFTLFRRDGMTDEEFEADAAAITRDLATLKQILES